MTRRIFFSICLVALIVFVASAALFFCVLYDYFGGLQLQQLRIQTDLAAQGVAHEGDAYLENLNMSKCRVTWVASDGQVLYDNRSDAGAMENHLDREEIREAISDGYGDSVRHSLTLLEQSLYCAKRLPDGSVVRLSIAQDSMLTLFLGMAQPILVIFVLAFVLSLVLASRLSKQIVEPLNNLNLDDPLSNSRYDELSPLLRRIDSQQREIQHQTSELQQKQKEFDAVTENMTEGIILLNVKGNVLSINRAAQKLFGVNESYVGEHLLSVNRDPQISALLSSAKAGMRAEALMHLPTGSYQLRISPVISDDTPSGSVLLAIDVTEKECAEQMRREFTANVSHELKTPLHTIAGSVELLLNGMVKEEDTENFYLRIQRETQRLIHLVEDIIRLSHLDEGAQDMKRETVDLYALAQQVAAALQSTADAVHVTLSVRGESAQITGIEQLLESIIYNLLDNAIKYNREGGSASVTVAKRANAVILSVSDTGIGIPPEHQERIFERFYRVDKSRSKELGGTGLGLSIVKHAARLHGANIDLVSVMGEGTTITVTFPLMPAR